jgi:hypothetical protein
MQCKKPSYGYLIYLYLPRLHNIMTTLLIPSSLTLLSLLFRYEARGPKRDAYLRTVAQGEVSNYHGSGSNGGTNSDPVRSLRNREITGSIRGAVKADPSFGQWLANSGTVMAVIVTVYKTNTL